jgi:hypothetical protein
MPRIRSIKPETWTDEKLGRLSRDSRLLFIATWSAADDYGNLRGAAALLRAFAFPYDDVTLAEVESWTAELVSAGMLVQYLANGEHCLSIRHWDRHQRVDHPGKPSVPAPLPEDLARLSRDSTETLAPDLRIQGPKDLRTEGPTPLSDKAPPSPDPSPSIARTVFDHWAKTRTRPGAAKFTTDRRSKVKARLAEGYTAEELCKAVDGMMATPHNNGDNDRGERYDDLTIACQSAANVDRFIGNAERPPTPKNGRQQAFPEPERTEEASRWAAMPPGDRERLHARVLDSRSTMDPSAFADWMDDLGQMGCPWAGEMTAEPTAAGAAERGEG